MQTLGYILNELIIHKRAFGRNHITDKQLTHFRHCLLASEDIRFAMLDMLSCRWTGELALCLISICVIVRNCEGSSYSEESTGNCKRVLSGYR